MEVRGIKSYVLRSGRMSVAQKRCYDKLSPQYCISAEEKIADYCNVFGNSNPVIAEIGFGSGSAVAGLAQQNPGINYLGIEVFKAGIGHLLWEIEQRNLANIRIIEGDAAGIVCNILPPQMAGGFHIFFP
ncbi:MAG: tRNA (guanosine(46)-N7)-methyltransferase TrmB, partial [Treponema sp.]|nr:tRNA (guanosine(46)-N7)-methyltransferase TrmB [Treponema sp.]